MKNCSVWPHLSFEALCTWQLFQCRSNGTFVLHVHVLKAHSGGFPQIVKHLISKMLYQKSIENNCQYDSFKENISETTTFDNVS